MKKPSEAAAAAAAWWEQTRPDPAARQPGDRAAFARLRRCATVVEAMQEVSTIVLFRQLGGTNGRDLVGAGLLAGVLACVREDVPGAKAARLVGPKSPERPETAKLKPLRFRRLLEATEADDKLLAFRRLVQFADARLPVTDLAYTLLFPSERRQREWLLAYWNALPPAATALASTNKDPAS